MSKAFQLVEYVDLRAILNGVLHPYNITSYYTDQNKRTYCLLEPSPVSLTRIESADSRLLKKLVPVTTLKSSTKLIRHLVSVKILPGDGKSFTRSLANSRNAFEEECKLKNWSPIKSALKMSQYESWQKRIREQLKHITNDRDSFYEESKINETKKLLKDHFKYRCSKFGWSPLEMEEVCDQAMREFIIEQVMSS